MESPKHPNSARVAAEVRAEMGRQGITSPILAQRAGIAPVTLWRRLNGKSAITVDDLEPIARALGLTVTELVDRADLDGAA